MLLHNSRKSCEKYSHNGYCYVKDKESEIFIKFYIERFAPSTAFKNFYCKVCTLVACTLVARALAGCTLNIEPCLLNSSVTNFDSELFLFFNCLRISGYSDIRTISSFFDDLKDLDIIL